jgi:riboflavin kinase/FMN adenylyltransferase
VQVIRDLAACPRPAEGCAVTIGAYDGVHEGHRLVIAEVKRRAEAEGLATAVVTFDRHPAMVVRPESAPLLLTDLDQRLELLDATGIDYVVVLRFDEERVQEVLVGCLRARLVAVGSDFHFGHRREGTVMKLAELGDRFGFTVDVIELVGLDGKPASEDARVSSTAVRHALRQGRIAEANRMLGHAYEVRGLVRPPIDSEAADVVEVAVPGEILLPADGRYTGQLVATAAHDAVLTIGAQPARYEDQHARLLRAHIAGPADGIVAHEGERVKIRFTSGPDGA